MSRVAQVPASIGASALRELLGQCPELAYCHVSHESSDHPDSLLDAAFRDPDLRPFLFELARNGFMAYNLRDGATSFVRHAEVRRLWIPVKEGRYEVDDNEIVYTYTPPTDGSSPRSLVVVFSSMPPKPHIASLSRHFFTNFSTLQKYVAPGSAVLRIADLGGVTGAYYTDTHARPANESQVQSLIRQVAIQKGIAESNVCLYGSSKGGSGALLHGLLGNYSVVAVDPIVSDDHYLDKHRDLHLVAGVFPLPKSQRFCHLFRQLGPTDRARINIITSRRSPQFEVLGNVLGDDWFEKAAVFDADNPAIKDHPDVSPLTLHLAVMLINMSLTGLCAPTGLRTTI